MRIIRNAFCLLATLGFVASGFTVESPKSTSKLAKKTKPIVSETKSLEPITKPKKTGVVTLGAGCFWCVEAVYQRIEGITKVTSGYMGGKIPNPTYEQICTGRTGHAEVVKVDYDPEKISLEKVLAVFWKAHDPTTLNRQGPDRGTQYRSAIFYHDESQREIAEQAKKAAAELYTDPIVTEITAAPTFWPAETYHQDFFANNPRNPYCRAWIPPKLRKLGLTDQDK